MGFFGSYKFPNWANFGRGAVGKKSLRGHISPFQFSRFKHDIQGWKAAIDEMELGYYPQRIKAQRIYMDTVLNGHIESCLNRRYNLTLLKDFGFFRGETINQETTELFKTKWFYDLMKYALEARMFGYSLIEFGDIVNNSFPNLTIIPRENVSPDRKVVTSIIYQLQGEEFTDPKNPYYNWTLYVDTPSDRGTSPCGYGLLYKVANYEIFLRNILGQNANYNELFAQPLRWAKSAKMEGEEYEQLCQAMEEMGSQGWIVTDLTDEIQLLEAKGNGQGYKTYADFEKRLEQKISKVLLGHADALDSIPGKLGGNQDGEVSPVAQALEDLETVESRFIEQLVNDQLIPKLIAIGFPIPEGLVFKFKNDKEKEEIRDKENANNKVVADIFKTIKDAGGKPDWAYFTERTGIQVTEAPEPEPAPPMTGIKNKLEGLYGRV